MRHRFTRVIFSPKILGAALLTFIFIPIPEVNTFARIISSTPPLGTIFFVFGVVGLVLSASDRKVLRWLTLVSLITVAVGIFVKVEVASSENLAFKSCYQIQSPLDPDGFRDGVCEATYNWTTPAGSSRLDAVIDFRSTKDPINPGQSLLDTNWNLSAINHSTYNYYDWDPTKPTRERLPLDAYWAGQTEDLRPIVISYTGEGNIKSADRTEFFTPTYAGTNTLIIEDRSSKDIEIFYRWSPPSEFPDAPFAAIRITDLEGEPIRPAVQPLDVFLLLVLTVILAGAVVVIAINIQENIRVSRPDVHLSPPWLIIFVTSVLSWTGNLLGFVLTQSVWFSAISVVSMLVALVATYVAFGQRLTSIMAAIGISMTSLMSVFLSNAHQNAVPVLRGGDDFLTYESFARDILLTGSLRAGEDVFWFAPGIRYTLHVLHLAFGDGNLWLWAVTLFSTLAAFAFAVLWLLPNRLDLQNLSVIFRFRWRSAAIVASIISIGLLAGSDVVFRGGWILFSEFPTWPAIAIAFALSIKSRGSSSLLILAGLLLGFSTAHRSNQMLGALAIAGVAIWLASSNRQRDGRQRQVVATALLVLVPFVLIAGLVPLHNWVYGRQLVFTHDPDGLQYVTAVSPLALLEGSEAWVALGRQIQGLLVWPASDFPIPYDAGLSISEYASFGSTVGWASRLALAGLVILLFGVATKRIAVPRYGLLLFVVPTLFFLPHVFLNLSTYYPRHVVVGYLTLNLAVLAIAGGSARLQTQRATGPSSELSVTGPEKI